MKKINLLLLVLTAVVNGMENNNNNKTKIITFKYDPAIKAIDPLKKNHTPIIEFKTSNAEQIFWVTKTLNDNKINGWFNDFGGTQCVQFFESEFKQQHQKGNKYLIAASETNATTVLNWLNKTEHWDTIDGLYLEKIQGNAKDSILSSASRPRDDCGPLFTFLPFAQYWIPVLSKIKHPSYNPFGQQEPAPNKRGMTTIISHDPSDPVYNINYIIDLYSKMHLRNEGLYFFDQECSHLPWVEHTSHRVKIKDYMVTCQGCSNNPYYDEKLIGLHQILKKHALPHEPTLANQKEAKPLYVYQPTISTLEKQKNFGIADKVRNTIDIATLVGLGLSLSGIL